MNRFRLNLRRPATVSPTTDIESDSNNLDLYDAGIVKNSNDDSRSVTNLLFDKSNTNGKKKNLAKNFIKDISDRFDHMGQEINHEFYQIRKDLQEETRSKTNKRRGQQPGKKQDNTSSNSASERKNFNSSIENQLVIDGDELIMNEIKLKAERIRNNFSKTIRNMSDSNREKVESLKHNMSERIKKKTEFAQALSSSPSSNVETKKNVFTMKIPNVVMPTVAMPTITVPNITMPNPPIGNSMLRQLKRKLQQWQPEDDISNSENSYDSEKDTTLEFLQDRSHGVVCDDISFVDSNIESLEETVIAIDMNKYSMSWEDSSIEHHFSITAEEDELI